MIAAHLLDEGRANAKMVAGDATVLFHDLLPDNALAAVHVYFPDPWWKRRHRKRRLMRESFVRDIERVLQPGGKLHFWTDVEEYFQVTLALLAAQTTLEGPLDVPEPPPESAEYRTHFERRTRLEGQPVYGRVSQEGVSAAATLRVGEFCATVSADLAIAGQRPQKKPVRRERTVSRLNPCSCNGLNRCFSATLWHALVSAQGLLRGDRKNDFRV